MPEFIPDTDGTVLGCEFSDLDPFQRGYIEAMLFTECSPAYSMTEWLGDEAQEALREGQSDGNIPGDAGYSDISPDAMIQIHSDTRAFQRKAGAILSAVYVTTSYDAEAAGRDFWYTRNGHGVGFWDRKELEGNAHEAAGFPRVGDPGFADYLAARENEAGLKLTKIAETFGEVNVSFDADAESPTGYGFVNLF